MTNSPRSAKARSLPHDIVVMLKQQIVAILGIASSQAVATRSDACICSTKRQTRLCHALLLALTLMSSFAFTFAARADAQTPRVEELEALAEDIDADAIFTSSIVVADDFTVTALQLCVDISHPTIGNLRVTLRTPSGIEVVLHDQQPGLGQDLSVTYSDGGVVNGAGGYDCECCMQPLAPLIGVNGDSAVGTWTLSVENFDLFNSGVFNEWTLRLFDGTNTPVCEACNTIEFIRGDADGNGATIFLFDALFLLNFGFAGGVAPPCLAAADFNRDLQANVLLDALFALNFGFGLPGAPPPQFPYPNCGKDSLAIERLGCEIPSCP